MFLFDVNAILATFFSYPISYAEFIGTATGLLCVYLTAKEKVICWPVGIINIFFFFVIFYQVQLYSDMLLQLFFLGMTLYGWWKWTHPKSELQANKNRELRISRLTIKQIVVILSLTTSGSLLLGTFMLRVHTYLPEFFPKPAAMPYADAFITLFSITANLLLTVKKIESWILWVLVDIASVFLFAYKGIKLIAIEYAIFGIIAAFGYYNWAKEQRSYKFLNKASV